MPTRWLAGVAFSASDRTAALPKGAPGLHTCWALCARPPKAGAAAPLAWRLLPAANERRFGEPHMLLARAIGSGLGAAMLLAAGAAAAQDKVHYKLDWIPTGEHAA